MSELFLQRTVGFNCRPSLLRARISERSNGQAQPAVTRSANRLHIEARYGGIEPRSQPSAYSLLS
jgi:hypothetical protein